MSNGLFQMCETDCFKVWNWLIQTYEIDISQLYEVDSVCLWSRFVFHFNRISKMHVIKLNDYRDIIFLIIHICFFEWNEISFFFKWVRLLFFNELNYFSEIIGIFLKLKWVKFVFLFWNKWNSLYKRVK